MTDWTRVGLQNHAYKNFQGVDSQKVKDFKAEHAGERPDARFKLSKSGDVTIETGARVTRNHGGMASFKRFFSKVGFGIRDALSMMGVQIRTDATNSRNLRHAGFELDKAVNNLVQDIANSDPNSPMDDKKIEQRLAELGKAQSRLAIEMENNDKSLRRSGKASDEVMKRIETNIDESIAAALKAKPGSEKALFKGLEKVGKHNWGGGGVAGKIAQYEEMSLEWDRDGKRQLRNEVQGGWAQPHIRAGAAKAARSLAVADALKDNPNLDQTMTDRFVSGSLGRKKPTKESVAFLNSIAKKSNKGKLPRQTGEEACRQLTQQLSGLKRREAAALIKSIGYDTCRELFSNGALDPAVLESELNTLKEGGASKDAIAEKQALYDNVVAARKQMVTGIANDLELLNGFSLVDDENGKVDGAHQKYLIEANAMAPTLKDRHGDFVHSESDLEDHFDDVFRAEVLEEEATAYFRGNTSTPGLLNGMLNRYTGGKLNDLSDTLANTVRQGGQYADQVFKPTVGPDVPGAPHPEMVLKAMKASVSKFENPPPANRKVQKILTKVQQGMDGKPFPINPALKGKGKGFVQSSIILRGASPTLSPMSRDPNETERTRQLANPVSQLIQAVGNGVYKNMPGRIRDIEKNYIDAAKADYREKNGKDMPHVDVQNLKTKIRPVMHEIENFVADQFTKDSAIAQYKEKLSGVEMQVPSQDELNGQVHLDGRERSGDFTPVVDDMTKHANESLESEVKRGKHDPGAHGISEIHGKDFKRAKITLNGAVVTSHNKEEFNLAEWKNENLSKEDQEKVGRDHDDLVAKKRWTQAIEQDAQKQHPDRLPVNPKDLPRLTAIVNQATFASFLVGATNEKSPLPFVYSAGDANNKLTYQIETTDEPGVYNVTASQEMSVRAISNFRDPQQGDMGSVYCDKTQSSAKQSFTARIDVNDLKNPVQFINANASYKAVPGSG